VRTAGLDRPGDRTRLVYLLAPSHSGSTLLALLLAGHREICTVGELKATSLGDVSRYRCSCGELLRACPFWTAVAREMSTDAGPFDIGAAGTDLGSGASPYVRRLLRPLHRGAFSESFRDVALHLSPAWRARLAAFQLQNARLARTACRLSGKSVIVDSSKVAIRLKYLLRNPALDIRVIRVIRDGRAVALTYMDPARFADAGDPQLRGGGSGGDRASERLAMADAAREWRRSTEEAEAVLSRLPRERWTESRYEDLCRDPVATLRRLFAFVGVDPEHEVRDRPPEYHVLGNGMRFDRQRPVRLDERWREELGPADLAVFDGVAGALLRRLGYGA
jgi:hypothetical protein